MKKIIAFVMAIAMCAALAGCNLAPHEPTAGDLLRGLSRMDRGKYNDFNVTFDVSTDDVGLRLESGLEVADGIIHAYDMNMTVKQAGLAVDIQAENWTDLDAGKAYLNVMLLGQESGWEASDTSTSQDMCGSIWTFIDGVMKEPSDKDRFVLENHESGDDYVITCTVDSDSLDGSFDGVFDNAFVGDSDLKIDKLTLCIVFDEDSHDLKSMTVSSGDDVFALGFSVKTLNGNKTLEIPADVLAAPAAEDDDDNGILDDIVPELPELSVDDERFYNDGEGEDALVDGIAMEIARNDPDYNYIRLTHYMGMGMVTYSTTGPDTDWSGTLAVRHVYDDMWPTPAKDFEDHYLFLAGWYESEPVSGSSDDTFVLFVKEDGLGEMDFAMYDDDLGVYVEASVYAYTSMDTDDVFNCLVEFLATAGIDVQV